MRLDAGYHPGITEGDREPELQKIDTTGASAPRWMSLIEAIKHIESGLSVSSVSAQVALKKKIGCGEFPVKWADALGPADTPNIEKLALSQLVLSTPGLAPDGVSLRPLLVLRSAVLAAWPQGGDATDTVPETPQLEQAAPWMSLVEAVEHIRIVEGCDSIEALRQLKSEIGDGMVQIRWADQAADDEPDGKRLSASDLILAGTGIALDEREGSFTPPPRRRADKQGDRALAMRPRRIFRDFARTRSARRRSTS